MPKHMIAIPAVIVIIFLSAPFCAGDFKDSALHQRIDTSDVELLYPIDCTSSLTAASACTVRMAGEAYWAISDWMAGAEIYKSYQDPSTQELNGDYPFEIYAVAMQMQFKSSGKIYASADIEAIDPDLSLPSCPYPGGVIDISSKQSFHIPRAGGYILVIPFEKPVTVNSPYFCGFYFSNDISDMGPEIVIDNDPYLCVNWNDWGEGYIDLVQNEHLPFPGNLVLFSIGRSVGSGGIMSKIRIISPPDSSQVSSKIQLRATELADKNPNGNCRFEYYHPLNGWTLIGKDNNSDVSLRNGIVPFSYQEGLSFSWNASSLAEGWYKVRATIYDQNQDLSSDTINIYLDNTPFEPEFRHPPWGDTICDSVTFIVDLLDEDASFVQFEYLNAPDTLANITPLLLQSKYGDVDGDANDGNRFADGEYGEFYNAPVLAAAYIRYFANHGYPDLARDGKTSLTDRVIVEELADSMQIRQNLGATDDNFIRAVQEYLERNGDQFRVDLLTSPAITDFDYIMGFRKGAVLAAIGQPYGHWLGIAEIGFGSSKDGLYPVKLYETKSGSLLQSTLRFNPLPEIMYNESYRTVDLALGIYPKNDSPAGEVFGLDFNPSDGFGFLWDIPETEGSSYYVACKGIDTESHTGEGIVRIHISCSGNQILGDVNTDNYLNVSDAVWIINYVFADGLEPRPFLMNGDINCDKNINVSDAIWIMNHVFVGGSPPCN
ncbi:MAG: hypothetical protein GWO41_15650 [candidate division Zixibacteria bacterium]|nr:hypothetical protein [candidate division Zixibacteria bacterium]NIR68132.1 hypothetical protein [candidate division Zixibacteria bacterium]NIS17796.1 hypothetical protein [candidate division Zixibacteria bacterium]NIS49347.1 hypothetical protein [candidate division Zixibacteria bacterium]NIT54124.1 hypothetical protein [candidate division Zixibacteria bacterium]